MLAMVVAGDKGKGKGKEKGDSVRWAKARCGQLAALVRLIEVVQAQVRVHRLAMFVPSLRLTSLILILQLQEDIETRLDFYLALESRVAMLIEARVRTFFPFAKELHGRPRVPTGSDGHPASLLTPRAPRNTLQRNPFRQPLHSARSLALKMRVLDARVPRRCPGGRLSTRERRWPSSAIRARFPPRRGGGAVDIAGACSEEYDRWIRRAGGAHQNA